MSRAGATGNDHNHPVSLYGSSGQTSVSKDGESQILTSRRKVRTSRVPDRCRVSKANTNRNGGIESLPTEILIAIFIAGISRRDNWSTALFPKRLSHVSRRWRNIALDTSSLWTHVSIHAAVPPRPEWLEVVLERSKACPIDLVLDFQELWSIALQYHIRRVCREVHRWRTFNVEGHDAALHAVFFDDDLLQTSRLPLLESLEIIKTYDEDDEHEHEDYDSDDDDLERAFAILEKGAPRLSAVTYSSLSFRTFIPPLSAITSLKLGGTEIGLTHEQFRTVVISSPCLNKLSLCQAAVCFEDRSAPIEIPTLLSFEYVWEYRSSSKRWPPLLISAVEFLTLTHLPYEAIAILQPKYPALQSLRLCYSDSDRKIAAKLMKVFPTITHFVLENFQPMADRFLAELCVDHSPNLPLWPELRSVTFDHYGRSTPNVIYTLISKRVSMGRPISHLKSSKFMRFPQEILDRLSETGVRLEDCTLKRAWESWT